MSKVLVISRNLNLQTTPNSSEEYLKCFSKPLFLGSEYNSEKTVLKSSIASTLSGIPTKLLWVPKDVVGEVDTWALNEVNIFKGNFIKMFPEFENATWSYVFLDPEK